MIIIIYLLCWYTFIMETGYTSYLQDCFLNKEYIVMEILIEVMEERYLT